MLAFLLSLADEGDHVKIEYLYHHFHDGMIRFAKKQLLEELKGEGDYGSE